MAISAVHYRFMLSIRDQLPHGGDVLQIGDANWYGDVDPLDLLELTDDPAAVRQIHAANAAENLFLVAKAFYAALFAPKYIHSIDLNGSDDSGRFDLNRPFRFHVQNDLVVNHGTAEHIFDIAQVFRTMHCATKPGGLMIHESPWQGWPDHGFYSIHPTLYYDLALANGYDVVNVCVASITQQTLVNVESRQHMHALIRDGKVPENAVLFVAMRHGGGDFRIPMQGIYDGKLDAESKQLWKEAR